MATESGECSCIDLNLLTTLLQVSVMYLPPEVKFTPVIRIYISASTLEQHVAMIISTVK